MHGQPGLTKSQRQLEPQPRVMRLMRGPTQCGAVADEVVDVAHGVVGDERDDATEHRLGRPEFDQRVGGAVRPPRQLQRHHPGQRSRGDEPTDTHRRGHRRGARRTAITVQEQPAHLTGNGGGDEQRDQRRHHICRIGSGEQIAVHTDHAGTVTQRLPGAA